MQYDYIFFKINLLQGKIAFCEVKSNGTLISGLFLAFEDNEHLDYHIVAMSHQ